MEQRNVDDSIYRLIEIAYEEQRLRLRPEIDKLIEERILKLSEAMM